MKLVPQNTKKEKIEIWFQDETRVGQQGSVTRIWAVKGTRPRVVKQRQFLSTYIYGAVCPQRQAAVGLVLPYANTECMNQHLVEISKCVLPDNHAVIIIDQAGWHSSKQLIVPDNITLLRLPPYSPELNSQENVWQWIKQKFLTNRAFDSFNAITDAAANAWNKFVQVPELIKSIAHRDWATL